MEEQSILEMDYEKIALVEKILRDIHNILSKSAELTSFDVIPVETNSQNKSPVQHVENCLGVESWCIKHVYTYCYKELRDKYLSKPKYTTMGSDRLVKLLNVTLMLNPEIGSLWNKRKELVQLGILQRYSELKFAKLVLTWKPKCNDAFLYRRWILKATYKDVTMHSHFMQTLINEELQVCQRTADKSANNYHSWSHRTWLLNRLISTQYSELDPLLIREFEFSLNWLRRHVSDYSCYHYRQFCVKNILKISDDSYKMIKSTLNIDMHQSLVKIIFTNLHDAFKITEQDMMCYTDNRLLKFLLGRPKHCKCVGNYMFVLRRLEIYFHEWEVNNELIRFYKDHETLWYHRRFILHEILVFLYKYFGLVRNDGILEYSPCKKCNLNHLKQQQAKVFRLDTFYLYSTILFNVLICQERNFIEERSAALDIYSDQHEKYLKSVEGLEDIM